MLGQVESRSAVSSITRAAGGGLDGVAREMHVADGALNLRSADKLSDRRQLLSERHRTRRKAVPQLQADVFDPGFFAHIPARRVGSTQTSRCAGRRRPLAPDSYVQSKHRHRKLAAVEPCTS